MFTKILAWACICTQFLIIYNYAVRLQEQKNQLDILQEHVFVVNEVMSDLQKRYKAIDNIKETVQNELIDALKNNKDFQEWSSTSVPFNINELYRQTNSTKQHP